jgi:hypothetical protein
MSSLDLNLHKESMNSILMQKKYLE